MTQAHGAVRLADGRELVIVPLSATDAPKPGQAPRHTVLYRRFCGLPTGMAPQPRGRLTDVDYRGLALVAQDRDGEDVAIAYYEATAHPGVAEVAVAVDPAWRRAGLATALLQMLAEAALASGFHEFTAASLATNRSTADLVDDAGGRRTAAEVIADLLADAATRLGQETSRSPGPPPSGQRTGGRLVAVDNLKTALVAWIIGGHALLGYSAIGGWEYAEVKEVTIGPQPELVLAALLGPSALLVIGTFFFIAGLFVPQSVARRGPRRFITERVVRLGVPYLVFVLLMWPLLIWLCYRAAGRPVSYRWVVADREPMLDAGPLWFVAVLLIFSVVYAGLVGAGVVRSRPARARSSGTGLVRGVHLVALAAGVALATFAVRLWLPARGNQPGDLHLWQWPQCAAMFGLGIAQAHTGLAQHVPDRLRRAGGSIVLVTVVLLPMLAFVAGVSNLDRDVGPYLGGWSWQALLTATVEGTLVVAGSVWLLGAAQRRLTGQGRLATASARSAYAAFILQGVVLFALALALRPLAGPAEAKAFIVAAAAIAGSFWLGWLLVARTALGRFL